MSASGLAKGRDVWYRATTMPNAAVRNVADPAPTIAFGHDAASAAWVDERPATTVTGPRDSRPGHHDENESGSQQRDAVRVTVQEAAILQSFVPDYPWQGSRTAQFRQIGNAIPPGLAVAILGAILAIGGDDE